MHAVSNLVLYHGARLAYSTEIAGTCSFRRSNRYDHDLESVILPRISVRYHTEICYRWGAARLILVNCLIESDVTMSLT